MLKLITFSIWFSKMLPYRFHTLESIKTYFYWLLGKPTSSGYAIVMHIYYENMKKIWAGTLWIKAPEGTRLIDRITWEGN